MFDYQLDNKTLTIKSVNHVNPLLLQKDPASAKFLLKALL
jgi:hypothetical protein